MKGSRGAVLLGGGEGQGQWHGVVLQTALRPRGFHQLQVPGEKNTLLRPWGTTAPKHLQKTVPDPHSQPRQPNWHSLGGVCCDPLPFCRFHSPRTGAKISAHAGGGDPGAAVIYCSREAGLIFLTASSMMDEAKACSEAVRAYAAIASRGVVCSEMRYIASPAIFFFLFLGCRGR